MLSGSDITAWVGALRFVSAIVSVILLSSIVALGLGAAHGTKLAHAPLDDYKVVNYGEHRWSTA